MNHTSIIRSIAVVTIGLMAVLGSMAGCVGQEQKFVNTDSSRLHPLPPLSGDAPTSADARQISELAKRMQSAIFQRDVSGFIACCTPTDAQTRKERSYFANDFFANPVFGIDIIVYDPVARSRNVVEGTVRWHWSYRVDKKINHREYVAYARFIRTSDGWQYDGPIWDRLAERDVQVWYLAGYEPAAKAALAAFHAVKYSVQSTLKARPTPPQIIKLYPSPNDLKFGISLSYAEDIDGWNEPGESIRLVSAKDRPEAEFRGLIAHEYGHVCTFALGPTANDMPWWALEGIAELAAEPFENDGVEHVRSLREESTKGTLVPMSDLADMNTIRPENFGKVYTQGRGVVRYVLTTYGAGKLDAWLRAMANGTSYARASKNILNTSDTELEKRWRRSLQ